jgi:uncharacterized membrane protein YgcG
MLIAGILVMGIMFGLYTPRATAQGVNDFVVNSFDANYAISDTAKLGALKTTETIDVTFSGQNHGILRAIPGRYNGHSTRLHVQSVTRDGQSEYFEIEAENNNEVLRIGDPEVYVTGKHTYQITYTQERVVQQKPDGSWEFFWDVNGDQWQQPFTKVTARISQVGKTLKATEAECYAGVQGSTEQNCTLAQDSSDIVVNANNLGPGQTLTIRAKTATSFQNLTFLDKVSDYKGAIVAVGGGLLFSIFPILVWFRKGRDFKGTGIVVPQFDAPLQLLPAEVGLLHDFELDARDVTATIIDLAVKKYIRIHEETNKVLMFESKEYTLELMQNDITALKPYEQELLQSLFSGHLEIGARVLLDSKAQTTLYKTVQKMQKTLMYTMKKDYKLFDGDGQKQLLIYAASTALIFLGIGIILQEPYAAFGFAITLAVTGLCAAFMIRRSREGVEALEHVKGLKLYLNVAEKDRLAKMQSTDRPYAEPSKTPELFEKLLPFAIALGVEKSWSKQFDPILTQPPDWYAGGNVAAFQAGALASSLSTMSNEINSSFTASTSSSGGASGSAGGGGGGGGGGGW